MYYYKICFDNTVVLIPRLQNISAVDDLMVCGGGAKIMRALHDKTLPKSNILIGIQSVVTN